MAPAPNMSAGAFARGTSWSPSRQSSWTLQGGGWESNLAAMKITIFNRQIMELQWAMFHSYAMLGSSGGYHFVNIDDESPIRNEN